LDLKGGSLWWATQDSFPPSLGLPEDGRIWSLTELHSNCIHSFIFRHSEGWGV
jgi:hypothetical protein